LSRINGEINTLIGKSAELELKMTQHRLHNNYKKYDPVLYCLNLFMGIITAILGLILFVEM